jgi:hypothetical protein
MIYGYDLRELAVAPRTQRAATPIGWPPDGSDSHSLRLPQLQAVGEAQAECVFESYLNISEKREAQELPHHFSAYPRLHP